MSLKDQLSKINKEILNLKEAAQWAMTRKEEIDDFFAYRTRSRLKWTGLSCLHPGDQVWRPNAEGRFACRGVGADSWTGTDSSNLHWEHCLRNSRTLLQSRDVSESDEARARLLSMHSTKVVGTDDVSSFAWIVTLD